MRQKHEFDAMTGQALFFCQHPWMSVVAELAQETTGGIRSTEKLDTGIQKNRMTSTCHPELLSLHFADYGNGARRPRVTESDDRGSRDRKAEDGKAEDGFVPAFAARKSYEMIVSKFTRQLNKRAVCAHKEVECNPQGVRNILQWLKEDDAAFSSACQVFRSYPDPKNLINDLERIARQFRRVGFRIRCILFNGDDPGRDNPYGFRQPPLGDRKWAELFSTSLRVLDSSPDQAAFPRSNYKHRFEESGRVMSWLVTIISNNSIVFGDEFE